MAKPSPASTNVPETGTPQGLARLAAGRAELGEPVKLVETPGAPGVPGAVGVSGAPGVSVETLGRRGLRLLQQGRVGEAIAVLRAAATMVQHDASLWAALGLAFDRSGSLDDAAACIGQALAVATKQGGNEGDRDPGAAGTRTHGTEGSRRGRDADARDSGAEEKRGRPTIDIPGTWLLLSSVHRKRGDLPAAQAACRAALTVDSNSALAWQCLALILQQQRCFEEAIQCLECYARLIVPDATHWAVMGNLLHQSFRIPQACDAYTRAAMLDPANVHYCRRARRLRFVRDAMDGLPVDAALAAFRAGDLGERNVGGGVLDGGDDAVLAAPVVSPSAPSVPPSLPEDPTPEFFEWAVGLLGGLGRPEAAAQVAAKWQELFPSATPAYLLQALAGDGRVDRSPTHYVVEHFDRFAAGFDAQLVGVLGYDVPQTLAAAIANASEDAKKGTGPIFRSAAKMGPVPFFADALDAGCGTGLCGPLLRPMVGRLAGVDLSPKMVELARQRGCYDELGCAEIVAYLGGLRRSLDLIAAADVLIYIGDLRPLFAAAAAALRPGGLLAVSTESCSEAGAGVSYELRPSGRFAHAAGYVRAVAREAFIELACIETTLRLEGTRRLPGNVFVFQRKGGEAVAG